MNAIIEIGSNSLKLLIFEQEPEFAVILDSTTITRLSEGYNQSGEISLSALTRNIQELKTCLYIAKSYNCKNISLYGTMIFRSASNAKEVLQAIYRKTGLELQVLSGEEEAQYSFLAATHALPVENKQVLVVDTGGGSTEFIFGFNNEIQFSSSLDLGAVTLTDKFSLQNEVESSLLEKCEDFLSDKFNSIEHESCPDIILGIGGTVTTISAIVQKLETYQAEMIQGSIINLNEISNLKNKLAKSNLEKRQNIIGLSPKRADIILGGVLIIKAILEKYGATKMVVCDNGLRYGLALKEWRKK